MSWLDLTRCEEELFCLDINSLVILYIPAKLKYKNADIYMESNIFTTNRQTYKYNWMKSEFKWSSHSDYHVEFVPKRNGSYKFEVKNDTEVFCAGYLSVKPHLKEGYYLNSLCIQTLMPKLMGPIQNWTDICDFTVSCGYNMIHFTPFQELGQSDSAYSIRNQLVLDPRYNSTKPELETFLADLRREKVLSMTDVVYNHTANDTPWLKDHPEATFNLKNSPHLVPAFILDREIIHITEEIINNRFPHLLNIENENDLEYLSQLLHSRFQALKLEEYRQCNVNKQLELFDHVNFIGSAELKLTAGSNCKRFSMAANLQNYQGTKDDLRLTLNWLNQIEYDKMNIIIIEATKNIIRAARYERLDEKGPKYGSITSKRPICAKYFQCDFEYNDINEIINDSYNCERIFAHNGWVMNWDPENCFVSEEFDVYLKRHLVPWDDSIKLNYGNSPSDCPALWSLMSQYTKWTAYNFDGIRVDNCHSTPLHVAEYFLQQARLINPQLMVLAELFTGSSKLDNSYVSRLGLDCLVRESLIANNPCDLGSMIGTYGGLSIDQTFSNEKKSSTATAILMDITHDNSSCIEKRTVADCLSTAAIIAFSNTPVGSSRGFDELVPKHINVVTEKKQYQKTSVAKKNSNFYQCKSFLNKLHIKLNTEKYRCIGQEVHDKIVIIRRRNTDTNCDYILAAHTVFENCEESAFLEINTRMTTSTIIFFGGIDNLYPEDEDENAEYINGLKNKYMFMKDIKSVENPEIKFKRHQKNGKEIIKVVLEPGNVLIIKGSSQPDNNAKNVIKNMKQDPKLKSIVDNLTLTELNQIMFSCEKEEQSNSPGDGCYNLPGYGAFPYAGFAGVYQLVRNVLQKGYHHDLIENAKNGTWLLEYFINRIQHSELKLYLQELIKPFLILDNTKRARLTLSFIYSLCELFFQVILENYPNWFSETNFARKNAVALTALFGKVNGALWPMPEKSKMFKIGSLSAGLPHFSEGIWRCWGRDTLISIQGALILTGRMQEAVAGIVCFGSTLRHGLIPNLLGEGLVSRYNCRDATWFWLNSVKNIWNAGYQEIITTKVSKGFATDDSNYVDTGHFVTVEELLYEILDRHGSGISFTERNAGSQIDSNMDNRGFKVESAIDENTGFPTGGSLWNCGTWMDKMGESARAGNRGIPSTPRDGAPVELVGVAHSVALWLAHLHDNHKISRNGFNVKDCFWTWKKWAETIKNNFDNCFWLETGSYYKDTYGSSNPEADNKLRCNYPIALAVSPTITEIKKAVIGIDTAHKRLLSGLGLRTLSPDDPNYRQNYTAHDSDDKSTAKGANYHQGPSWLWPVGYLLQATYIFNNSVSHVVAAQEDYLNNSDWMGLPELQNGDGSCCSMSCPIQTWSHATMIEFIHLFKNGS